MKKTLVLKIGTSTLTSGTNLISRGKIEDIGRQILSLREDFDIVLVSSGAIAAAKQYINISDAGRLVESKQAMAAIGQPLLMRIYNEIFSDFGIRTAQCLMTYRDFENVTSRQNTLNTITELIKYRYVPIINENDTTAVEEIILGDNDKLSALVAALIGADLLVLASDIDGVFDKNPHLHADAKLIPEIYNINEAQNLVEERDSGLGTGGMNSKLEAAMICQKENIETRIVNGGANNFLIDALAGKLPCTKLLTPANTKAFELQH
ncbi:MAG: glutamate 5-kinase [Acidobacteria bacterium]|jgi:glutamate 5-kinase|nr:glutamate 5-kinase [Acidobacteriota bacterium]